MTPEERKQPEQAWRFGREAAETEISKFTTDAAALLNCTPTAECVLNAITDVQADSLADIEAANKQCAIFRQERDSARAEWATAVSWLGAAQKELATAKDQIASQQQTIDERGKSVVDLSTRLRVALKDGEDARAELSTYRAALEQAKRVESLWEIHSVHPAPWLSEMNSELFDALDHLDVSKALADPPANQTIITRLLVPNMPTIGENTQGRTPTPEEMLRGASYLEAIATGLRDVVADRVTPIEEIDPSLAKAPMQDVRGTKRYCWEHESNNCNGGTAECTWTACPDCQPAKGAI